jgi:hypothetical protein
VLLPNHAAAYVEDAKLIDYLLNAAHPRGGDKAYVFLRYGFSLDRPEELRLALLKLAQSNDVVSTRPNRDGISFVVDGQLATPSGRFLMVRSVWSVPRAGGAPRFVSAYPQARPA